MIQTEFPEVVTDAIIKLKPGAKNWRAWSRLYDYVGAEPIPIKAISARPSFNLPTDGNIALLGDKPYTGSNAKIVWITQIMGYSRHFSPSMLTDLCQGDSDHPSGPWFRDGELAIPLWWTTEDDSRRRANSAAIRLLSGLFTLSKVPPPQLSGPVEFKSELPTRTIYL